MLSRQNTTAGSPAAEEDKASVKEQLAKLMPLVDQQQDKVLEAVRLVQQQQAKVEEEQLKLASLFAEQTRLLERLKAGEIDAVLQGERLKLRAEMSTDIDKLLAVLVEKFDRKTEDIIIAREHITITHQGVETTVSDVVFTFLSPLPIDSVRGLIDGIEDGHVMAQTLAKEEDYDGERNYGQRN